MYQVCQVTLKGKLLLSGFAVRECGADGMWKPNFEQNATDGWTNYSDCFKPDPVLAGITVRIFYCQA